LPQGIPYKEGIAINLFEIHVPEDLVIGIFVIILILTRYIYPFFHRKEIGNQILSILFWAIGVIIFIVNYYYFAKGGFTYDGWSSWIFGTILFLLALFSCWVGFILFKSKPNH
jgi:hypothetical protein